LRRRDRAVVIAACVLIATPAADAAAAPKHARRAHADATVARYRVIGGSVVDLGWTGIAHRQRWPVEQRIQFELTCTGESCAVHGGAAGAIFGAPTPLSTGGVPVCVVSRLRAPLAGTVAPKTGCGKLHVALNTTVYTGAEVAKPCPICAGDRTPNDGQKDGRCQGGASDGKSCDANAASALFSMTSNDCLPLPGSAAGTLAIDLAPLTTGSVTLTADRRCKRSSPSDGRCFCAGQAQPNACESGACGVEECDGPVDGVCAHAPYRTCALGTGTRECEDVTAGAGACEERLRRCFRNSITATGTCDPARPTYVAIFCAPPTSAPAINTTAGLPGPARLRLVLEAISSASAPAATGR